jgi:hypothetical protein
MPSPCVRSPPPSNGGPIRVRTTVVLAVAVAGSKNEPIADLQENRT